VPRQAEPASVPEAPERGCTVGWVEPCLAYRPFDGTDAAVADVGEVEIELQPVGAMRAGSTTKGISDSVLNFGFADRWELVLQGTAQAPLEGRDPLGVPDAAFLKSNRTGLAFARPVPAVLGIIILADHATDFGLVLFKWDPDLETFTVFAWTSTSRNITNPYDLVFSLRPANDQISHKDAKAIWNNIAKSTLKDDDLAKFLRHLDDDD
jgi:hypothetical protein